MHNKWVQYLKYVKYNARLLHRKLIPYIQATTVFSAYIYNLKFVASLNLVSHQNLSPLTENSYNNVKHTWATKTSKVKHKAIYEY